MSTYFLIQFHFFQVLFKHEVTYIIIGESNSYMRFGKLILFDVTFNIPRAVDLKQQVIH